MQHRGVALKTRAFQRARSVPAPTRGSVLFAASRGLNRLSKHNVSRFVQPDDHARVTP
jgi:hypothetical protein